MKKLLSTIANFLGFIAGYIYGHLERFVRFVASIPRRTVNRVKTITKAIKTFVKDPVGTIQLAHVRHLKNHFERQTEYYNNLSIVAELKSTIAEAKADMVQAQMDEEYGVNPAFYAEQADKEFSEAIKECKRMIEVEEAHQYFGAIGKRGVFKLAALPTAAFIYLSITAGERIAAALGYQWYHYGAQFLCSMGFVVVVGSALIYFTMRYLFDILMRIRIMSLKRLQKKNAGASDALLAKN